MLLSSLFSKWYSIPMRHKLCRSFHPWCPGVKNRCLYNMWGCVYSVYPPTPCDDWENIYTLSYYHHQIGCMNYIIHCLGLGHETMVCAVCLSIFLWYSLPLKFLSGVPDLWDRNKILSGGDLSHYQVPHCIRVFFYFVWFVFIRHTFQFYFELCTYCNTLDIYLS